MGEKHHQPCQLSFHKFLRVEFQGSRVTSDRGLVLVRELDERLGLVGLIQKHLMDSRTGRHPPFPLAERVPAVGRQPVAVRPTDGAARALSGATGSTPEEPCAGMTRREARWCRRARAGSPTGTGPASSL